MCKGVQIFGAFFSKTLMPPTAEIEISNIIGRATLKKTLKISVLEDKESCFRHYPLLHKQFYNSAIMKIV